MQKRAWNVYMFRLTFHFACHRWWLGLWSSTHHCTGGKWFFFVVVVVPSCQGFCGIAFGLLTFVEGTAAFIGLSYLLRWKRDASKTKKKSKLTNQFRPIQDVNWNDRIEKSIRFSCFNAKKLSPSLSTYLYAVVSYIGINAIARPDSFYLVGTYGTYGIWHNSSLTRYHCPVEKVGFFFCCQVDLQLN